MNDEIAGVDTLALPPLTRPVLQLLLLLSSTFYHYFSSEGGIFLDFYAVYANVADPDLNPGPSDPYVFGPPRSGSGSISQSYGSGSRSFYLQAKIVIKTMILFCDFF